MKTTKMIPWKRGRRGKMKEYVWIGRTGHLMTSGTMEKVRKIVVLTGSMQKKVFKQEITSLERS